MNKDIDNLQIECARIGKRNFSGYEEELWKTAATYCDNDVAATEAVFEWFVSNDKE